MVFTLRPFGHTFALWQRALALVQPFVLLYRPLRLVLGHLVNAENYFAASVSNRLSVQTS